MKSLYKVIVFTVSALLLQLSGRATQTVTDNPIYGYDFDNARSVFGTIPDAAIQQALATVNRQLAGGNQKLYFATVYLGEIDAYALVKDELPAPGELAIVPASRKLDEEEIDTRFRLTGGRFREFLPDSVRNNCAIYILGYYISRNRQASSKPRIHFKHELLVPGRDASVTASFLDDLTQFVYERGSGQPGLSRMQQQRIERLGDLLLGRVQPARELTLKYTLPDSRLNAAGGWLEQARANLHTNGVARQTGINLHNNALMIAAYAPAFSTQQLNEIDQSIRQLQQELAATATGQVNFKLIVTDGATAPGDMDAINRYIDELAAAANTMGVWVHFNLRGITLKFIDAAGNTRDDLLCNDLVEDNIPPYLAYMKAAQKVTMIWPAMLKITTWMAGKGDIPEHYINPDDPNFDPVLTDAWSVISNTYRLFDAGLSAVDWEQAGNAVNTISRLAGNTRASSQRTKHTPVQLEFAFVAGIWNSIKGTLLSGPDQANLVKELFCNAEARKQFIEGIKTFREKAEKVGGYGAVLWKMVKERYTQANATMLSYYMGGHLVDAFTIYIGFLKTGILSRLATAMNAIDPGTYIIEPILRLVPFTAKTVTGLVFRGTILLGNKTKGMLLRITGETGKHIFEVFERTTGRFKKLVEEWRLLEQVILVTEDGMMIPVWHSPKLKEMYGKLKSKAITLIDALGNRHKIVDAEIIESTGSSTVVDEIPAAIENTAEGEAEVIRAVASEKSVDGHCIYVVEGENGKPLEAIPGGSDGTGGGGRDGEGNGGSGGGRPPRGPKRVMIAGRKSLGGDNMLFELKTDDGEIVKMTRNVSQENQVTYSFEGAGGKQPAFSLTKGAEVDPSLDPEMLILETDMDIPVEFKDKYVGIENIMLYDAYGLLTQKAGNTGEIKGILSVWDGFSKNHTNLTAYRQLAASGESESQAVRLTPIGVLAKQNGFQFWNIIENKFPVQGKVLFSKIPQQLDVRVQNRHLLASWAPEVVIPVHSGSEHLFNFRRINSENNGIFYSIEFPHNIGLSFSDIRDFTPQIDFTSGSGMHVMDVMIDPPKELPGIENILLDNASLMMAARGQEADIINVTYEKMFDYERMTGPNEMRAYQRFLLAREKLSDVAAAFNTPEGQWARRQGFAYAEVNEGDNIITITFKRNPGGAANDNREIPRRPQRRRRNNRQEGNSNNNNNTGSNSNTLPAATINLQKDPRPVDLADEDRRLLGNLAEGVLIPLYAEGKKVLSMKRFYSSVDNSIHYLFEDLSGKVIFDFPDFVVTVRTHRVGNQYVIRLHFQTNLPEHMSVTGLEQLILADAYGYLHRANGRIDGLVVECSAAMETNQVTFSNYRKGRIDNKSKQDAAWETPIGKWARGIGFTQVDPEEGVNPDLRLTFANDPGTVPGGNKPSGNPSAPATNTNGNNTPSGTGNNIPGNPVLVHAKESSKALLESSEKDITVPLYIGDKHKLNIKRTYDKESKTLSFQVEDLAGVQQNITPRKQECVLVTDKNSNKFIKVHLGFSGNMVTRYPGIDKFLLDHCYHFFSKEEGAIQGLKMFWKYSEVSEVNYDHYLQALRNRKGDEAVLRTPAGEWAKQNGFTGARQHDNEAERCLEVTFYKPGNNVEESIDETGIGQLTPQEVPLSQKLRVLYMTESPEGITTLKIGDMAGNTTGVVMRRVMEVGQTLPGEQGLVIHIIYEYFVDGRKTPLTEMNFYLEKKMHKNQLLQVLSGSVDKPLQNDANTITSIIRNDIQKAMGPFRVDAIEAQWAEYSMDPYVVTNWKAYQFGKSQKLSDKVAAAATPTGIYWSGKDFTDIRVTPGKPNDDRFLVVLFIKSLLNKPN